MGAHAPKGWWNERRNKSRYKKGRGNKLQKNKDQHFVLYYVQEFPLVLNGWWKSLICIQYTVCWFPEQDWFLVIIGHLLLERNLDPHLLLVCCETLWGGIPGQQCRQVTNGVKSWSGWLENGWLQDKPPHNWCGNIKKPTGSLLITETPPLRSAIQTMQDHFQQAQPQQHHKKDIVEAIHKTINDNVN